VRGFISSRAPTGVYLGSQDEVEEFMSSAVSADGLVKGKQVKILSLGGCVSAALGRPRPPLSVDVGWFRLGFSVVYELWNPSYVARNTILRPAFDKTLERVLESPIPDDPMRGHECVVVHDAGSPGIEWLTDKRLVFDTETFGRMFTDDFRVDTIAVCDADYPGRVFVADRGVSTNYDAAARALVDALRSAKGIVAHNAKFDINAIAQAFGVNLGRGSQAVHDTYVLARFRRGNSAEALDDLSHIVGMGGHKREGVEAAEDARSAISQARRAGSAPVVLAHEYEQRVTKTGKVQRRRVVTESRPPTREEFDSRVLAEWVGASDALIQGGGFSAKWPWVDVERLCIAARDVDSSDWTYAYGLMRPDVRARYCALDVHSTALLFRFLREDDLRCANVLPHLARASEAIAQVEAWGIRVDVGRLADADKRFSEEMERLVAEAEDVAPGVNISSRDSVSDFLFKRSDGPRLKPPRMTEKGAASVDKAALKAIEGKHPLIAILRRYRVLEKLRSQYTTGLAKHVLPDGRVHPSFRIMGAETGRMSCTNPPAQTIPSRGTEAKVVKSLFAAEPGRKLVVIDYKTLEVRIAAALSGDEKLINTFRRGVDPHTQTAQNVSMMLWGTDFETCGGLVGDELVAEQKRRRTVCKGVNFGILYGQSPDTIAEAYGLDKAEAQRAHDSVLGAYTGLRRWINGVVSESRRSGVTHTWWNGNAHARNRPVPDIGSSDKSEAGHGERQSYNSRIQGTGHEYCLASGVELVNRIRSDYIDAKLVLLVHDSIMFDVSDDDLDELVQVACEVMTGWPVANDVPLEVDVEVGQDWGSTEPYSPPVKRPSPCNMGSR